MAKFEKIPINIQIRIRTALAICFLLFFCIVLRLWYLQIIKGEYFRNKSENNRIRRVFVLPPRGHILDRNGEVIVKNRPAFNIELVREDSPNPSQTLTTLAEIVDSDPEILIERLKFQKKRRRFEPQLILKDVDRNIVAKVAAQRFKLPGIIISVNPARDYLYGEASAHVIGYIREINKEQLDLPSFSGYRQGDLVGQYGIEKQWERYLQGIRGEQGIIVNAAGMRIGEDSFVSELPGSNIQLSLDLDVQLAASKAFEDKKGALVAMDANTGEILAMVSKPGFDPNMFIGEVSSQQWNDLVSGSEKRMNNRAMQGGYPPGSVFKAIMAVAGLNEGVVAPHDSVACPGYYRFGSRNYRCWKREGHGTVSLENSLVRSCDVYYYILGQRLGIDRIHNYASLFGLGKRSGLGLVQENPGIVPSTEWKKKYFRRKEDQKWYPGETLSVAIGQGALVVTPMQMTRAIAALVNGGQLMKPWLVREIHSADGNIRDDDFKSEVVSKLEIDPTVLNRVKDALVQVVNNPQGTGKRAQIPKEYGVLVGGKTGTSQVVALSANAKGEEFKDHAWFSGFAPSEKPEIVVTALVENGGGGGAAAAPIVSQVLEAYFASKLKNSPAEKEVG
ncbi:MAG: penicillin-binding protein 2 [Bdellovibrionota bacterium]